MHSKTNLAFLLAAGLSGDAFKRPERDPLRVETPDFGGGSSICGITSILERGGLFAPDDGNGGGGGDEKKFSQADLDKAIGDRLAKLKAEKADLEAKFNAQKTEFETIKAQVGELSGAAEKAREEAEMKGLDAVQKAEKLLGKAQERIKTLEAESAQKVAALTAEVEKANTKTTDYAKRQAVAAVLGPDVLSPRIATRSFMEDVEIELNDKLEPVKFTYAGKDFDKGDEVRSEYFKANPIFVKAPEGGAGTPQRPASNGSKVPLADRTAEELFAMDPTAS